MGPVGKVIPSVELANILGGTTPPGGPGKQLVTQQSLASDTRERRRESQVNPGPYDGQQNQVFPGKDPFGEAYVSLLSRTEWDANQRVQTCLTTRVRCGRGTEVIEGSVIWAVSRNKLCEMLHTSGASKHETAHTESAEALIQQLFHDESGSEDEPDRQVITEAIKPLAVEKH